MHFTKIFHNTKTLGIQCYCPQFNNTIPLNALLSFKLKAGAVLVAC
jgi:hypothetical protein